MKRKLIPPFLMLFSGAVSSIIMYILHYDTNKMLIILFAILIVFYVLGSLFKLMLDIFDKQNEKNKIQADSNESIDGISLEGQEGQVNIES